jgi:hypothetical protein
MGAFLEWLDGWAKLVLPGTITIALGVWFKKSNSSDHNKVADSLQDLTGEVGELRGELSTYIREHSKVHERLPY